MKTKITQIEVNGKMIQLTNDQIEKVNKPKKFELSQEFWDKQEVSYINYRNHILEATDFDLSDEVDDNVIPTEYAETIQLLPRLLCIMYEMNGGEVLDEGFKVAKCCLDGDWRVGSCSLDKDLGFKFKTKDLAKQFLEEQREILNKLKL